VSSLEDITQGEFNLVIPDSDISEPKEFKKVNRVIMCSGKVYYDLLKKHREQKLNHIAIIRIEQLYPFPTEALKEILKPYKHVKTIIWCQEEPKNQGAWYSTQHHLQACLESTQTLHYAGRAAAASPAVGYPSVHLKQQDMLVNQALELT
jgi:2-oxoglutarate dehydrogenase E1 component